MMMVVRARREEWKLMLRQGQLQSCYFWKLFACSSARVRRTLQLCGGQNNQEHRERTRKKHWKVLSFTSVGGFVSHRLLKITSLDRCFIEFHTEISLEFKCSTNVLKLSFSWWISMTCLFALPKFGKSLAQILHLASFTMNQWFEKHYTICMMQSIC